MVFLLIVTAWWLVCNVDRFHGCLGYCLHDLVCCLGFWVVLVFVVIVIRLD